MSKWRRLTPVCCGLIETAGKVFVAGYRRDALRATREGRLDEADRFDNRRQAVEAFVRELIPDVEF